MQNPKHCVFCGTPFATRAARKTHNKTCEKNVNREHNQKVQAKAAARRKEWEAKHPMRPFSPEGFSELFDDLPDGAFFAMAEEFGIQPEDFIE